MHVSDTDHTSSQCIKLCMQCGAVCIACYIRAGMTAFLGFLSSYLLAQLLCRDIYINVYASRRCKRCHKLVLVLQLHQTTAATADYVC